MSTLAAIRTAIVAEMAAIPGIGAVHDRERFAKTDNALKALYVTDGRLLGWYLRRVGSWEESDAIGSVAVIHRWLIRGFCAFEDEGASEVGFDDLIEAIRLRFRDSTLNGTVASVNLPDGPYGIRVEDSGTVVFCGAVCHSAKLSLTTRHFEG